MFHYFKSRSHRDIFIFIHVSLCYDEIQTYCPRETVTVALVGFSTSNVQFVPPHHQVS